MTEVEAAGPHVGPSGNQERASGHGVDATTVVIRRDRQHATSDSAASSDITATERIKPRPVFVDESGRRRRWVLLGAYLIAALCTLYVAVAALSIARGGDAPLLDDVLPELALPGPVDADQQGVSAGAPNELDEARAETTSPPSSSTRSRLRSTAQPVLVPEAAPESSVLPTPTAAARPRADSAPPARREAGSRGSNPQPNPPANPSPPQQGHGNGSDSLGPVDPGPGHAPDGGGPQGDAAAADAETTGPESIEERADP